jgi:predicted lipid-binding transport protein (Tim44 family)
VTEERHEELSTADLADRRDLDAERADVREGPGPSRTDLASSEDAAVNHDGSRPLLPQHDAEGFRARWTDVQTGFVDAPRQAVEQADQLVAELMQHLAKTFADARSGLERQWDRGDDVPTDDLRTAFQRYRSFFERLLAT